MKIKDLILTEQWGTLDVCVDGTSKLSREQEVDYNIYSPNDDGNYELVLYPTKHGQIDTSWELGRYKLIPKTYLELGHYKQKKEEI